MLLGVFGNVLGGGSQQHAYSETILNRLAKVMAVSGSLCVSVCVRAWMLQKQTVTAKYESGWRAATAGGSSYCQEGATFFLLPPKREEGPVQAR